ncbi:fibronectin type III domain-containing protein [Marine Group I thaumarchaeote SCGC AAA799-N04]|uniref:Fibronectin type III domain-containing protein n=1 Tax=Marine Group I thaumarchaeote SCGC AAA799-N04 TaxID=1502293 RepID=A0A081RMI1_9ARCH|nr:fibronectin type III domain-containing protein [Marine Group I thaumarchaeote SCGC AAA799-N04]
MRIIFLLLLVIACGFTFSNSFADEYPILVSVSTEDTPGNGDSFDNKISSNGKFVVFMSQASNLVENDRNHQQDIFVRDLINEKTYLVSVSSDGTQGAGESSNPSISGDGKRIVFATTNTFDSEDENEQVDIYLHELDSGITTWVSKPVQNFDDDGNEIEYEGGASWWPTISDDGDSVFFNGNPGSLGIDGIGNLIEYDVSSKSLSAVGLDVGNGWPGFDVSGNGKKIVFMSDDEMDSFPNSNRGDLFVYDVNSEELVWINEPIDEFNIPSQNNVVSIDYDGRYVAFRSTAPNLVENDENNDTSFFLHDLQTSETKLISITPDGEQFFANSSIDVSGNGEFVLFQSGRSMVVYDVELEKTIKLTDDGNSSSGIDFEGEFISFVTRDEHSQISVSTNPPPDEILRQQAEIEAEREADERELAALAEAESEREEAEREAEAEREEAEREQAISDAMAKREAERAAEAKRELEEKKSKIAAFVDKTKDPKYYVDRYNNEPKYKEWFHENYPYYDSIEQAVGLELTEKIPGWVKNIFGWYANDEVSEVELLNAIKYLINERILIVN